MEYQIIISLLDKGNTQPSRFRTKNCVEIIDMIIDKMVINEEHITQKTLVSRL